MQYFFDVLVILEARFTVLPFAYITTSHLNEQKVGS
jgi:hypothetical protein